MITLTIIGVIAALTLPNLTQKWKKQERISQLQVTYSILQNANKMAIAEHGAHSTWDFKREQDEESGLNWVQTSSKTLAEKYFIPYVKTNTKGMYFSELKDSRDYHVHYTTGKIADDYGLLKYCYSVILDNGMIIHINGRHSYFYADVNGFSGPNIPGNDIFEFYLQTNGLNADTGIDIEHRCSTKSSSTDFPIFCAAKIINNGWQIPDDYLIKKF